MTITAGKVRYIKLGRGGCWDKVSLERGELHFGYGKVPHDLALNGDVEAIKELQISHGRDSRAAASDAREVCDFYSLGADCLWITFAQDHMWWTFADPNVTWLGFGDGHGERIRKSIGGWRNTDVNGTPLRTNSLSTKLTKVASYRRTICGGQDKEYVLRRINGIVEPLVAQSNAAREAMLAAVTEAIAALHWSDFETLVDIIFARSGWHRASAIGGTQKMLDLVIEQPSTGEIAAVQVKSKANQIQLEQFVADADATNTFDRLFFACHSPVGTLSVADGRDDVHIWSRRGLAETALRTGMADWIIEKIA